MSYLEIDLTVLIQSLGKAAIMLYFKEKGRIWLYEILAFYWSSWQQ